MFARTIGPHVSNSQEIKNMLDILNLPELSTELSTEAESPYSSQIITYIKNLYDANQLSAQDAIEIQICHISTLIDKINTHKQSVFKNIENRSFNKSTQALDLFLNYLLYSTCILSGFVFIKENINSPWQYPREDFSNGVCSTHNPPREVRNPIILATLIFPISMLFIMNARRYKMHDYSGDIKKIKDKVNKDLTQENKNNSKIDYLKKLIFEANKRYTLDLSESDLNLKLNDITSLDNSHDSLEKTFEIFCQAKIKLDKILNQLTHQQEKLKNLLNIELQRQQNNPAVQLSELKKEIQILMHKFLNDRLITSPENIKLIMPGQTDTDQTSRNAIMQNHNNSNQLNTNFIPKIKTNQINQKNHKQLFTIIPELILSPKANRHQFIDLDNPLDRAKFLIKLSDNINKLLTDIKKSQNPNNKTKSLNTQNLQAPDIINYTTAIVTLCALNPWAFIETFWFLISLYNHADKTQTTPGAVSNKYRHYISDWDVKYEMWCQDYQVYSQTPPNKCCDIKHAVAHRDSKLVGYVIAMLATPFIFVGVAVLFGRLDRHIRLSNNNNSMLPENSQVLDIKLQFTQSELNKIKDLANVLLNSEQIADLTPENIDQAIKIIKQNKIKFINFCKNKRISVFDFSSDHIDEKYSDVMSELFEHNIAISDNAEPSAPPSATFNTVTPIEVAIQIHGDMADGESYSLTTSNTNNGARKSQNSRTSTTAGGLWNAISHIPNPLSQQSQNTHTQQVMRPDDRQDI